MNLPTRFSLSSFFAGIVELSLLFDNEIIKKIFNTTERDDDNDNDDEVED